MRLNKGDAVVLAPDEPHAYIYGDLVECMANSDNVVRGGLTPKFKDTETLVNMMPYEMIKREARKGEALVSNENCNVIEYKTGYDEFRVTKVELKTNNASTDL